MMVNSSYAKAAGWMLLRCLLLTLIPAITHILSPSINLYVIVFLHNFFAFLFILPWAVSTGWESLITKHLYLHFLRAILSTCALFLWFSALQRMHYAEAISLSFSWALCSMLLAVLFFKEQFTRHHSIALFTGVTGLCFILKPGSGLMNPAAILVILTVILWSCADIIIKKLTQCEQNKTQCFYITFFMTIFTMPFALTHWHSPASIEWGYLLLQGIMFAGSMVAVFNAYGKAPLCDIMPLDFSRLVFMLLIAMIFFNEEISITTVIGAICILAPMRSQRKPTDTLAHQSASNQPLS